MIDIRSVLGKFGGGREAKTGRPRVRLEDPPPLIYAIGDVHGSLAQLLALESMIVADARASGSPALIIMLGDYVDRGPRSAQVIDHLLSPLPEGFSRLCVAGNHEAMMLDFLEGRDGDGHWLMQGGSDTLISYGMAADRLSQRTDALVRQAIAHVPQEHRSFIAGLPALIETPGHIFVHAGLRPGISIPDQSDDDLLWFRDGFAADYQEFGRVVVHGHTPLKVPHVGEYRIDVDTTAFATGRLTAVRLALGKDPTFLATGASL